VLPAGRTAELCRYRAREFAHRNRGKPTFKGASADPTPSAATPRWHNPENCCDRAFPPPVTMAELPIAECSMAKTTSDWVSFERGARAGPFSVSLAYLPKLNEFGAGHRT